MQPSDVIRKVYGLRTTGAGQMWELVVMEYQGDYEESPQAGFVGVSFLLRLFPLVPINVLPGRSILNAQGGRRLRLLPPNDGIASSLDAPLTSYLDIQPRPSSQTRTDLPAFLHPLGCPSSLRESFQSPGATITDSLPLDHRHHLVRQRYQPVRPAHPHPIPPHHP